MYLNASTKYGVLYFKYKYIPSLVISDLCCLFNVIFTRHLEEENESLRKRIQELEKQVSDLAATNEVLLEQNAQFRLQKRYHRAMLALYPPSCSLSLQRNHCVRPF